MKTLFVNLFAEGEHPVANHPNLHKFVGCLTLIDIPSDKSPSGTCGHRVMLTRKAAEENISSLLCMAVDFRNDWEGHNIRKKCGIITEAHIEDSRLMVSGYIYKMDFPEIIAQMKERTLGMSFELQYVHIADMRAEVYEITKCTFRGASILLQEKAAYRGTTFSID